MHHVSRIDNAAALIPDLYQAHSTGFRRATYADQDAGSVHMSVGVSTLEARGVIQPHLHSFEETFYVLEGSVIVQIGERSFKLGSGHFGLISTGTVHAWHNVSEQPARWLEMQAPQPRRVEYGRDTFFVGGDAPSKADAPDLKDPANAMLGYFDEAQLPTPGAPSQMEGFNPLTGVAVKMFVDRSFNAVHQSLFLIQYMHGAKIDLHDHTFEESYLIVSGEVEAVADGQKHLLRAGDAIWTSVGCIHSFANVGTVPVRWIETQAPLPPAKEVFRYERDWAKYV